MDSYIHNSLKPHRNEDEALGAIIEEARKASPLQGTHDVIGKPFIREVTKGELKRLYESVD